MGRVMVARREGSHPVLAPPRPLCVPLILPPKRDGLATARARWLRGQVTIEKPGHLRRSSERRRRCLRRWRTHGGDPMKRT
jgi:hypothetical protein